MNRDQLIEAVIAALRETQRRSGHEEEPTITETTVPIGELIEFDSYNGVEATVALEELVGRPMPVNLFTDEATRRPLTVSEVVDRVIYHKLAKEP